MSIHIGHRPNMLLGVTGSPYYVVKAMDRAWTQKIIVVPLVALLITRRSPTTGPVGPLIIII